MERQQGTIYQVQFNVSGLPANQQAMILITDGASAWTIQEGNGLVVNGVAVLANLAVTTGSIGVTGGSQVSDFAMVVGVLTSNTSVKITSILPQGIAVTYITGYTSGTVPPGPGSIEVA